MNNVFKSEEEIVKGMQDLLTWMPMTASGASVINSSLSLIGRLQAQHKEITESSFWIMRKFAEEVLTIIPPDDTLSPARPKEIFFYNYPEGEVYLGYAADLDREEPPVVFKAIYKGSVQSSPITPLSLDEVTLATKKSCEGIQTRLFGMPLEEPAPESPSPDWEILLRIEDNPFLTPFEASFLESLEMVRAPQPKCVLQEFKDKFNLSHILSSANRPFMDLRVFCMDNQLHWEWVSRGK